MPVYLQLTEGVTFEVLVFSSYALSPTMLPNIFGTPVEEQLPVPSSHFLLGVLIILKSSSLYERLYFWKQSQVTRNRRIGWAFHRILDQKLLDSVL